MANAQRHPTRDPLSLLLLGLLFAIFAGLSLSSVFPLTYDEAWTYIEFSRHGVVHSATHYPLPNNHVAFSILEALTVPHHWVLANPMAIRVSGLLPFAALLFLLRYILMRTVQLRGFALAGTVAALVLSSPLVTLYCVVARGYLAGTVLILFALVAGALRGRRVVTAISCALATWTVPTFAFAAPGVFLSFALLGSPRSRGWTPAVQACGLFAVLSLILYAPILGALANQSQDWNTQTSAFQFATALIVQLGNFSQTGIAVACGLGLGALVSFAVLRRGDSQSQKTAIGLFITLASTLLVIGVVTAFGMATTPFLRVVCFVPLFVWLALLLAARPGTRLGQISFALLIINAAAGALLLIQNPVLGDPQKYPLFAALNPSALSRTNPVWLKQNPRLRLGWDAVPVARLYARSHELELLPVEALPLEPCATGLYPPASSNRIATSSEPPRLICF